LGLLINLAEAWMNRFKPPVQPFFPYEIHVTNPPGAGWHDCWMEHLQWLWAHATGKWDHHVNSGEYKYDVYKFENKADAMLFKLTWGGRSACS
jgi:hypothetical protein